jgi:hypothetical protein
MCARLLWLVVALVMLAPAGAAAKVLYVGDSLGVGTAPYLREQLDEAIEVDAETGRPSTAGVDVLGSLFAAEDDVVVFDLGTNDADPAVLADSLAAARGIAGDRCLVIATLNRPPLNGAPVEPLNRVITRFAASDPNSELVDWRAAATRRPDLLTDGIHATAEGYSLRAGLFAEAIESCLAFGTIGDAAPALVRSLRSSPSRRPPRLPSPNARARRDPSSASRRTSPVRWRSGSTSASA